MLGATLNPGRKMSEWTRDLDADARDCGHLPHATHDGARPNVIHQYIARVRELEAEVKRLTAELDSYRNAWRKQVTV